MQSHLTPAQRFWQKVDYSGSCWLWLAGHVQGYGQFWVDGQNVRAHRVSYELTYGEIPSGLLVRHSCDNRPCVNPAHLSIGTYADNARDAVERNRLAVGEAHYSAKLTTADVLAIRARYRRGHRNDGQRAIAREYGMSHQAIGELLSGESWRHI